jgi:UDP:flavonoid glycosyltransferase YjiC (YdhE family)
MHIAILTIGTRGEVDPCLALGQGLQDAGFDITIATHALFEPSVCKAGLDFSLIDVDIQGFLNSREGQAVQASGRNPLRTFRIAVQTMRSYLLQIGRDAWRASQGAEAILYTIGAFYFAPSIAEKLAIPAIGIYPYPAYQPTSAFPSMFSPVQKSLGGFLNRQTHLMIDGLGWLPMRPAINRWRQEELDLPGLPASHPRKLRQRRLPVLYGFSSRVVPRPPDWGQHATITGYWFLEEPPAWSPPPDLVTFLDSGPPPVCASFGSLRASDSVAIWTLVAQSLARAGQRGVLVTGSQGAGDVSGAEVSAGDLFVTERVPFGWLFPRTAAVIHHGGSGTTGLGLRAGRPTIVIPSMMDQPFWGQRVLELGVGPPPIPRKQLSVDRLAAALRQVASEGGMLQRATALGQQIRREDGLARAVEIISQVVSGGPTPSDPAR